MSITFLLIGLMVWSLSTLYKLFIWLSRSIGWRSIWQSILISLHSEGHIFAFSLLQLISGFWVAVGIYFSLFGEDIIQGIYGALIIGGLFLLPLWAVVAISEQNTKVHHAR